MRTHYCRSFVAAPSARSCVLWVFRNVRALKRMRVPVRGLDRTLRHWHRFQASTLRKRPSRKRRRSRQQIVCGGETGGSQPCSAGKGSVKWTMVPQDLCDDAHSRPPCASTIDRQMERPRPIPSPFVVKKGSNIRSRLPGSIPVPVSVTVMETSAPLMFESSVNCRSCSLTELIASTAFMIRLTKTC